MLLSRGLEMENNVRYLTSAKSCDSVRHLYEFETLSDLMDIIKFIQSNHDATPKMKRTADVLMCRVGELMKLKRENVISECFLAFWMK
jgi:hypothetical protein